MNWMLVSYSAVIISVQLVLNTLALIWASGPASFNLYLCSTRSGDDEPEREKGRMSGFLSWCFKEPSWESG